MEKFRHLLTPGRIGNVRLKNRVIMAPMETNLPSITGEVNERLIEYYEERAKGGPGAIIVEFTGVDSVTGKGSPTQLLLDQNGFISGHNQLVEAIHRHNCKVFLQLHHAGRQTTPGITGTTPISASSIPCKVMKAIPREMSTEEVRDMVKKFVKAAHRAKRAGYDGVELHAAHGYLLNNFLSPYTNKRTDEYGGTTENRARIVTEIIRGIRERLGGEYPVIVRFSVDEFVDGGLTIEESIRLARLFERAGASAIHVSTSIFETMERNVEPMSFPDAWRVPLAAKIKENVGIPVITVGVIRNPETAEKILQDGKADFIALGRALLADPEWVAKVQENKVEEIVPCTSCCYCLERVSSHLPIRCSVNPRAGREKMLRPLKSLSGEKKKVIVIGGGVAGLSAAVFAAQKGHPVTLYEASHVLGGLLDVASAPPDKHRWKHYWQYLLGQIKQLSVEVILNHPVTEQEADLFLDAYVIVATGMMPRDDETLRSFDIPVSNVVDVLRKKVSISRQKVLVLGAWGAGLEVAHYLLQYDNEVIILSRSGRSDIGANIDRINRRDLLGKLEGRVQYMTECDIFHIENRDVYVRWLRTGETTVLESVDWLVLARGFKSHDPFQNERFIRIGSCVNPKKIIDCVYEAYLAVEKLE